MQEPEGVGMKAALLTLVAVVCLAVAPAGAQTWLVGGPQLNGVSGSGEGGNKFDGFGKNIGAMVELGVRFPKAKLAIAMQLEWYKAANSVGTSSANATFLVPFGFEIRYFLAKSGSIVPYIGLGTAWSRMSFDRMQGGDNQWLVQAALGLQMRLANGKFIVQPSVKPYVVVSNSLEQSSGLQGSLLIGTSW